MIELIVTIVLISGLGGLTALLFWKIPVLVQLSFDGEVYPDDFFSKTKKKVRELIPPESFDSRSFLQKILLRIRILSLKTENKTNNLLQKLSQQDENGGDNYWAELKKTNKPFKKRGVQPK